MKPIGFAILILLQAAASGRAQTPETIDADRPHVGTGTHVVGRGEVQFELGGQMQAADAERTYGSPVLMRVGLSDRIEARVASDGFLLRTAPGETVSDASNLQLGAKIRVAGERDEPWLSMMSAISIGLGDTRKGLASGTSDFALTVLAGRPIATRAHLEANYGLGSLGSAEGIRFAQHLVTGAVTYEAIPHLTTYVEGAWWSKQALRGDAVSFVDYGVIYGLTPHLLVDGGMFTGLTDATADYGVFAGLSVLLTPARAPSALRRASRASAAR
jgi:hypothetical protein